MSLERRRLSLAFQGEFAIFCARFAILVSVLLLCAGSSLAGLIDTRSDIDNLGATVDGTISANEYGAGNAYNYTGGGSGFGGTLGGGTLYMQSDLSTLYIGATINGNLGSNLITIYLDTKSGGFTDATMFDNGDSGRFVITDLTRDVNDTFPTGFLPDYALQFGNGFTNLFELTGGSLNFTAPTVAGTGGSGGTGSREVSIPLSYLGLSPGQNVDYFTTLISDTRFTSNESIPSQTLNGGGNPGFGSATVNWDNFNRFATVPEPSTAALFLMGGVLAWRFRSRRKS